MNLSEYDTRVTISVEDPTGAGEWSDETGACVCKSVPLMRDHKHQRPKWPNGPWNVCVTCGCRHPVFTASLYRVKGRESKT